MNKKNKIFEIIKSGCISWEDCSKIIKLSKEEFNPLLNLAQEMTFKEFGNILKVYIPTRKFPAISITGNECALECEHCNKKYLHGMTPILNNKDLKNYLLELSKNDGIGALISGGCEPDGSVPLFNFLDTIKDIKSQTNLIINVHTGLLKEETARKLANSNVDIISFDVNMDEEIVENIYHLKKDLSEYKKAVNFLKNYNLNIVPHICIGLYYGKLHKELESIKFIKESEINPSLIVIIALIPPKNSKVHFEKPNPIDIAKIIAIIRFLFPHTEISLGCMRPRGNVRFELEMYAIKAGITRIEIPSRDTLKWLRNFNPKIRFKFFSACCAIPNKFEEFAISKDSDIKRYLNI
ncbi:MAG: radical SAM protein [Promethearchaeota archaeon]